MCKDRSGEEQIHSEEETKKQIKNELTVEVKRHEISSEKIVTTGLVAMGCLSILGFIANLILTGQATGSEIPMAVISGLTGYIGGYKSAGGKM